MTRRQWREDYQRPEQMEYRQPEYQEPQYGEPQYRQPEYQQSEYQQPEYQQQPPQYQPVAQQPEHGQQSPQHEPQYEPAAEPGQYQEPQYQQPEYQEQPPQYQQPEYQEQPPQYQPVAQQPEYQQPEYQQPSFQPTAAYAASRHTPAGDVEAEYAEGDGLAQELGYYPEQDDDRRHRERTRQARRRRSIGSFVAMMVILVGLGLLAVFVVRPILSSDGESSAMVTDYPGPGTDEVVVQIPDGATGSDIALILKDAGVVATSDAFTAAYQANPAATSIQPGAYNLAMEMKASDAVEALLDPNRRADTRITFPEGWRASSIYERIADIMGANVDDVYTAAHDYEALGLDGPPNTNPDAIDPMEGWFYPGTYVVAEDAEPIDVLQQMLDRTITELDNLGVAEDDRLRVLTVGSIAFREVSNVEELPMVTRVIENRLLPDDASGADTLGMDSTLDYAWAMRNPGVTMDLNEHNTNQDPYNTRLHPGLPPSPIGSIDKTAMEAVVMPAEGDWVYFVSNLCTGETFFNYTQEEHEAAAKEINQWYEENGGSCLSTDEE